MKKNFVLSIDCGADGFGAQFEADGVHILPYSSCVAGKKYALPFLTNDDAEKYYTRVKRYGSSDIDIPLAAAYEAHFDEILDNNRALIHLCESSKLSASYKNTTAAAKNTLLKFRTRELYIVDTKTVSAGLSLLLAHAVKLRDGATSAADCFINLLDLVECIETFFTIFDVDYFSTFSPLGNTRTVGSLLNARPYGKLIDGSAKIETVFKGNAAAMRKMRTEILSGADGNADNIAISASGNFEFAAKLADSVCADNHGISVSHMSPSLGRLCGAEAVCAAYLKKNKNPLENI